ncbi:hypothetical protein BT69DRAFT_1281822 [Atractiella rhizophila]|nr:hypothetical protein BT69DRAFT_1281822 [Atractiella rhizophila]
MSNRYSYAPSYQPPSNSHSRRGSADAQTLLQDRSADGYGHYSQGSYGGNYGGAGKFSPTDVAEQDNVYGVYNDFNNRGSVPYSSVDMYNHDLFPTDTKSFNSSPTPTPLKSEFVAAPTLGRDWGPGEARKVKQPRPPPSTWFRSFREEGFCGFNYKSIVFVIFFFLIALGVTLYFVIPREPGWAYDPQNPLVSNVTDPDFTRTPLPSFQWDATFNLAVDARSNWLDLHFNSIDLTVKDLGTQKVVGEGTMGSHTVPARKITHLPFDFQFNYTSPRSALNDTTFNDFYTACGHIYQTTTRPSLDLSLIIKTSIRGIIGSKSASTSIIGITCPVSIQETNV